MPIIEYRCIACGTLFENLQSHADDEAAPCPRCGDQRVERQLSVFAVARPRADSSPGPCGSSDCACRRT